MKEERAYLGSTGISLTGVCDLCSGDGQLSKTGYDDETCYPCPDCNGTGGSDQEKIKKFRELNKAYRKALMGDNE